MSLNTWHTEKIVERRIYTPTQAAREIGIGLRTIYEWIEQGRLVTCSQSSRFYGIRLREAIEGRELPT